MSYKVHNKKANVDLIVQQMLSRSLGMFKYTGLPDSIPAIELERILQTAGQAFVTEVNGELYALSGSTGGVQDVYYNPTQFIVANPALKLNSSFTIGKDGVLVNSDFCKLGFMPVFMKYATLLTENQLTISINSFNTRLTRVISASDSKTKESAENYLKQLYDGKMAVIGENALFEGVKVHNSNSGNSPSIGGLIELQQYLKSAMFEEIGLEIPFNLKRERLNTSEVEQGENALSAFVDSMLICREESTKKINEKYGTAIEVKFSGAWENEHEKQVEEPAIVANKDDAI